MRLRNRTVLSFAVCMIAFMVIEIPLAILISRYQGDRLVADASERFVRIQAQYVEQQLSQVRFLIDTKAEALNTTTRDYAFWDSMKEFIRTREPAFTDDNLSDGSLRNAKIELVALSDREGQRVIARYVPADPLAPSRAADPRELAAIGPESRFWKPSRDGEHGLARIEGRLMLVSSFPVLSSDGNGEPAGFLTFAKSQGNDIYGHDGRKIGVGFRILTLAETGLPPEEQERLTRLGLDYSYVPIADLSMVADPADSASIRGYGLIEPVSPEGPLVLEVLVPPDLLREQRLFIRDQMSAYVGYSILYLIGIAFTNLIFFLVILFVLERSILARIYRISKSAMRILHAPDSGGSIPDDGDDELTMIGNGFNSVLDSFRSRNGELISANKKLRYAYREIAISHQALNASMLPVIVTDSDGKITRANNAFERILGYTDSEATGQTPNFLNPGRQVYWDHGIAEPAYEELFLGLWRGILDQTYGTWEGTVLNRKKNGEVIPMQLVISGIRSEEDGRLGFVAWMVDLSKRTEAEEKTRIEVYRAISELAETRDSDTGQHLRRISLLSRLLAEKLGWGPRMLREIEVFSPLHDVGKVGISDSVLLNPSRLSEKEFEVMKTHAQIGYSILRGRPTMEMAAEIAHCHHEWWDGTGYPEGRKGVDIPIAARIVAIVDVFDALRSRRPYKEPWSLEKALAEIRRQSGAQFDPDLVAEFLRYAPEFEEAYSAASQ